MIIAQTQTTHKRKGELTHATQDIDTTHAPKPQHAIINMLP